MNNQGYSAFQVSLLKPKPNQTSYSLIRLLSQFKIVVNQHQSDFLITFNAQLKTISHASENLVHYHLRYSL